MKCRHFQYFQNYTNQQLFSFRVEKDSLEALLYKDAIVEVPDVDRQIRNKAVHALKEPVESLEQIHVVLFKLFVKLLQVFALLHFVLELLCRLEIVEVGLDELPILGSIRLGRRLPVHAGNDILEPEELRDGGVPFGHEAEQRLTARVVLGQEVHV